VSAEADNSAAGPGATAEAAVEEPRASSPPPRPIRAAWLAAADTFDEYGRTLQPLAVGLMDEVVDVVILCPGSAAVGQLPGVPREVVSYEPPKWWRPGAWRSEALAAELRRRKVDVLHGLDFPVAHLTARLAGEAGLKFILSGYGLDDARRLWPLGGDVAGVLAASEPIREVLAKRRVCRPEQIHLVRPGVYHVRHPTCFSDPGCSASIVAGGRLDDAAAFEAVLRCFAELAARKADCAYFILGSGPAERRLRRRAAQLGLAGRVTFVDLHPVGQLTGVLKSADVYVSPAPQRRIDARSLLAIAAGVPVLAAAGDGANDFLHDGQTALLFSRGDSAELTVKLGSLLDDRAAARALAAGALRYIHEHHSPTAAVLRVAELYRQAAEARRGAG